MLLLASLLLFCLAGWSGGGGRAVPVTNECPGWHSGSFEWDMKLDLTSRSRHVLVPDRLKDTNTNFTLSDNLFLQTAMSKLDPRSTPPGTQLDPRSTPPGTQPDQNATWRLDLFDMRHYKVEEACIYFPSGTDIDFEKFNIKLHFYRYGALWVAANYTQCGPCPNSFNVTHIFHKKEPFYSRRLLLSASLHCNQTAAADPEVTGRCQALLRDTRQVQALSPVLVVKQQRKHLPPASSRDQTCDVTTSCCTTDTTIHMDELFSSSSSSNPDSPVAFSPEMFRTKLCTGNCSRREFPWQNIMLRESGREDKPQCRPSNTAPLTVLQTYTNGSVETVTYSDMIVLECSCI